MFTGSAALNLDAKGRLTMPTRYRASLIDTCGGQLVLTLHPFDDCLALYPRAEFMDTAKKLSEQRDSNPQVRQLKRRFLGQAAEIDQGQLPRCGVLCQSQAHGHARSQDALSWEPRCRRPRQLRRRRPSLANTS